MKGGAAVLLLFKDSVKKSTIERSILNAGRKNIKCALGLKKSLQAFVITICQIVYYTLHPIFQINVVHAKFTAPRTAKVNVEPKQIISRHRQQCVCVCV